MNSRKTSVGKLIIGVPLFAILCILAVFCLFLGFQQRGIVVGVALAGFLALLAVAIWYILLRKGRRLESQTARHQAGSAPSIFDAPTVGCLDRALQGVPEFMWKAIEPLSQEDRKQVVKACDRKARRHLQYWLPFIWMPLGLGVLGRWVHAGLHQAGSSTVLGSMIGGALGVFIAGQLGARYSARFLASVLEERSCSEVSSDTRE